MVPLKRQCIKFLCRSLSALLFTPGLTVAPGHSVWCDAPEPDSIFVTRLHVIRAFVAVLSCDFFAMSVSKPQFGFAFPGLDFGQFLTSVCQTSRLFLEREADFLTDLLSNCFVLCTQLFPLPEFRAAFAALDAKTLLRSFLRWATSLPIVTPVSPVALEAVSFLYMAAVSNAGFVALAGGHGSNTLVSHLLSHGQLAYEVGGYGYVHSLILATLLALVGDQTVAAQLSAPFVDALEADYDPGQGSHGDLVMNVVLNIYGEPTFLPSVAVMFHMIAPYCRTFSFATAGRIFALLERSIGQNQTIATLLLEGLAANLHQPVSGLWIVMAHKTAFFKRFDGREPRAGRALTVIRNFLVAAAKAIKATRKARLSNAEIEDVLARIQFEKGEIVKPKRFRQAFAGAMADTWREWIDFLFVRTASADIQNIQELQDAIGEQIRESLR
jgi:hypothetical protein